MSLLSKDNIKRLQDENQRLSEKCKKLQSRVRVAETDINSLNQYGRRNNFAFTDVPEFIEDGQLESTITLILSDTDVAIDVFEDFHYFGKVNSKSQPKKLLYIS